MAIGTPKAHAQRPASVVAPFTDICCPRIARTASSKVRCPSGSNGPVLPIKDLFGWSTAVESYEYSKYYMNMVIEETSAGVSLANGPVVAKEPGATPLAQLHAKGRFEVPPVPELLRELRAMIDLARPTNATFRTNHASNHLPLAGRLPHDRQRILNVIDAALEGKVRLRSERARAL